MQQMPEVFVPDGPIMATVPAICPVCLRPPSGNSVHARGPDFEYGTTGQVEWTYIRCSCDVVFLTPRPAEQALSQIYPRSYYAYDFLGKRTLGYRVKDYLDARAAKRYLRFAKLPPRSKVLDVGCGDGRLLRRFAQAGIEPRYLHGIELDTAALGRAKDAGFQVRAGRFEDQTFPPSSFGLVVMQQVLEHVSDPRAVLRKLHEVLVDQGTAIIETPNIASWDHALFSRRYWGGYHIPRHFYLFSSRSLRQLLMSTGFEVVACESLASPSFWIQSIHHVLAEHGAPPSMLRFFHPHTPGPLPLLAFSTLDFFGKALGVTSNMRFIARKN